MIIIWVVVVVWFVGWFTGFLFLSSFLFCFYFCSSVSTHAWEIKVIKNNMMRKRRKAISLFLVGPRNHARIVLLDLIEILYLNLGPLKLSLIFFCEFYCSSWLDNNTFTIIICHWIHMFILTHVENENQLRSIKLTCCFLICFLPIFNQLL